MGSREGLWEGEGQHTMEGWGVLWKEARENMWLGRSQRRPGQRCREVGSHSESGGLGLPEKEQCDFYPVSNR